MNLARMLPYKNFDEIVFKSEKTVYSQMIINKFRIPEVLVDIIKDYIYYNKNQVIQRYLKNILNLTINNLYIYRGHSLNVEGDIKMSYVDIINENNSLMIHSSMCAKCGEYCFRHMDSNMNYTRHCNYIEGESLYYYSENEFVMDAIENVTTEHSEYDDYWNEIAYANEIIDGAEFADTFEYDSV
jgi:hypothetical protein